MAYGLKYQASWGAPSGAWGYLNIYEKDWTGVVDEITLMDEAIAIIQEYDDLETPLLGLRCEFSVINDRDDYFELFGLLTATERKYRVYVTQESPTSIELFRGYLNVDVISHGYLHKQEMRLVASSYLSKLEHTTPTIIEDKQEVPLISIIDNILIGAGIEANIRVNCTLFPTKCLSSLPSGGTFLNIVGIDTEAFWEDDTERMNSQEVLESILLTFNCFMYWWDGYWYIEQFSDIWDTSVGYVEYTTGQSYDPINHGTPTSALTRTPSEVSSIQFRHTSQEIQCVPGNQVITIIYDPTQSLILNMVPPLPTLSLLTAEWYKQYVVESYNPTPYHPYKEYDSFLRIPLAPPTAFRKWQFFDTTVTPCDWTNSGHSWNGITNSVARGLWYDTRFDTLTIGNFAPGLVCKFKMTVTTEETSITIKYKYAVDKDTPFGQVIKYDNNMDEWEFRFWMQFAFITDTGDYRWIVKNEDPDVDHYQTFLYEYMSLNGYHELTVSGDSFDRDWYGVELSFTIPLGEVYKDDTEDFPNWLLTEDPHEFVVVIHNERVYQNGDLKNAQRTTYWGDITVTTTNNLEADQIEGSINTDFLNKKEIELVIGDNDNYNYTNGLLTPKTLGIADFNARTTLWARFHSSFRGSYPLLHCFFKEKFRMYNVTKQILSGSATSTGKRPFSLFTEAKQADKKFVFFGYTLRPSIDEIEMTLLEYDNESDVDIIEE